MLFLSGQISMVPIIEYKSGESVGEQKIKIQRDMKSAFHIGKKYIILKIVKKLTNTEDTMKDYIIGIDIGGTSVKLGLFTIEGELVHKWEVVTDKSNNGSNILNDICKSVKETLEEQQIPIDNVQGAGIGNSRGQQEVMDMWKLVQILVGEIVIQQRSYQNYYKFLFLLEMMLNVAALGELWKGGGKRCRYHGF